MTIEHIKGFKELTKEQQSLFVRVNSAHMQAVEDKKAWEPVSVKWYKTYIKVTFDNGDWLHYCTNSTWY